MTETAVRRHAFLVPIKTTLVRAGLLFLPAWTLDFPHAWAYIAVAFCAELATRLYLLRHDPDMIERRRPVKSSEEARGYQRFAQAAVQLTVLSMLVVCALDHRNGWSSMSTAMSAAGLVIVAAGLYVVFLAMRANTFASTVVTLHEGHEVISTGPYGHVRHPMYSGLILFMGGTALALGSWWGLGGVVLFTLVIAGRMVDEEKFLANSLAGYREYTERVRHRVVPLVW